MSDAVARSIIRPRSIAALTLRMADHLSFVVITVWVSHAWYYPTLRTTDVPPGIDLLNILSLLCASYLTLRLVLRGPLMLLSGDMFFLAVLVVGAFSLTSTESPSNTLGMVRTSFLFFGALLYFRYTYTPRQVLLGLFSILGALMTLSTVAAVALPNGVMQGFDAGRWRGVFGHKNSLGEYATLTLLLFITLPYAGVVRSRLHLVFGLFAALCLLLSGSATAIGVLTFGLAMAAFTKWYSTWSRRTYSSLLFYLFFVVFILLVAYYSVGLFVEYTGRDLTFTGRTSIWSAYLFFFSERPWSGWGWTAASTFEPLLQTVRLLSGIPQIQTAHNAYINLLVELGYPGFAAYVLWLLVTFYRAVRGTLIAGKGIHFVRLAVVCGLALHNMFESTAGAIPSLWLFALLATDARHLFLLSSNQPVPRIEEGRTR